MLDQHTTCMLTLFLAGKEIMKKRIIALLLTLLTILTLLPTAAFAAESTGVGITPGTDPNLWTTRLTASGQTYSYRPPQQAGSSIVWTWVTPIVMERSLSSSLIRTALPPAQTQMRSGVKW